MHGIESEVNSDTAYLDRSALYMPDEIPALKRARYELFFQFTQPEIANTSFGGCVNHDSWLIQDNRLDIHFAPCTMVMCSRNLVESKRTSAWSEVINGGPLGSNPYLSYLPHGSFDENGYLRQEAFEATDQGWVQKCIIIIIFRSTEMRLILCKSS